MDSLRLALVVAGVTCIAAAGLVPLARRLAHAFGILDEPGHRKVHAVAMPRLGGVAVFLSFGGAVAIGYALAPHVSTLPWLGDRFRAILSGLQDAHHVRDKLLAVLGGATVAFTVGLLDDVLGRRFPVWAKAAGQVLAALLLLAADVRTSFLPYDWMNALVTLFWIVGITNAFNLLDNMDGLSAGVAAVATGVLLLNAVSLGEQLIALILAAFLGSLLGFLFFNFNPATVFLGDCGSLFIGFVMASLTLLERYVSHASGSMFPVLMPVVVLAVPIVDTATVVVIRLREGRPIYVGDTRHLSHRLAALGFSQRAVALFIYLATLCLGLGAVNLSDATPGQALIILVQSVGFVALLLILLFVERRVATAGSSE